MIKQLSVGLILVNNNHGELLNTDPKADPGFLSDFFSLEWIIDRITF